MFRVKEEFTGAASSSDEVAAPQPVEGLYEIGPPPFLTKTFEMVDDRGSDHVVSWSRGGQSFVVWDPHAFSAALLPKYFKHSNFSSFVRQLNTYGMLTSKILRDDDGSSFKGFRKIDSDKWEFANEAFLRGQRHNLKQIRRRKTSVSLPHHSLNHCAEAGSPGLDAEMERLRREKQVLVMELIKLRQQDQTVRAYLQQMEVRLHNTERKQEEMMSFLARVMQKPEFLHQLVHRRKRQRTIEAAESSGVKVEPVSELEALALEMQGHRRSEAEEEEEVEMRRYGRELDEGFWEELLNEGFDEHGDGGEVEDVEVLADKLGFSCSPY